MPADNSAQSPALHAVVQLTGNDMSTSPLWEQVTFYSVRQSAQCQNQTLIELIVILWNRKSTHLAEPKNVVTLIVRSPKETLKRLATDLFFTKKMIVFFKVYSSAG